jgi:hypothetical protein
VAQPAAETHPLDQRGDPGHHHFEIRFGFDITAEGRSARRGAELVYEYDGEQRKVFLPSYFSICSPKWIKTDCPSEDQDGQQGTMPTAKPST